MLQKLCHKSVRDGKKEILKLLPLEVLPEESKKQVTPNVAHVSFNMSDQLEAKLENIKALLGAKSYGLSLAELIEMTADLALVKLQEKKFGKKVVNSKRAVSSSSASDSTSASTSNILNFHDSKKNSTLNVQSKNQHQQIQQADDQFALSTTQEGVGARKYISKKLKYSVWRKDNYKCNKCSRIEAQL